MAFENSPYVEEGELEEKIYEEVILLLALSLLAGISTLRSTLTTQDFNSTQQSFKLKASEMIPTLVGVSFEASQVGVNRLAKELKLSGLVLDFTDARFQNLVLNVFESNLERMLSTNHSMYYALLQIAEERGWDDAEVLRRFKLYYGLPPKYLKTVLAMEDALKAEGIAKKVINKRIQKRIDQLIEHRLGLAAVLIGTQIVEGSKDIAFTQLSESFQLDSNAYVKEWVSVVDDVTTQVCLSSHGAIAEIGQPFPNGYYHPPALDPVHPCRSSIRIRKRPQ